MTCSAMMDEESCESEEKNYLDRFYSRDVWLTWSCKGQFIEAAPVPGHVIKFNEKVE